MGLAFNIQPVRAEPKTWTVDDDGPADFHTIQEAVNAANSGDTIYVYNGTYYENVVVNETIALIGESRSTTIIDGNETGNVVTIIQNNVRITDFTIQKSGDYPNAGIYVKNASYCILTKNEVTRNDNGVRLNSSNHNRVIDNKITGNIYFGIIIYESGYNTLSENSVTNNHVAIFSYHSSSNTISGSEIAHNNYGISISTGSSNNTIVDNKITGNIYHGISLFSSSDNTISRNDIRANTWQGIYLSESSNNHILGNNVRANGEGIWIGILCWDNTLYHNNFVDNARQIGPLFPLVVSVAWDDGYPSGGNYWSDYNGTDSYSGPYQNITGSDGIGDTPYVIGENNQDNYPLMGMFSDFNVTSEYHVQTICNSSISDFQFNSTAITFNVTGENGTTGFCRICIPKALINETYSVFVNGTEVECTPLTDISNTTHNYIYFNYTHSTQDVVIIPEFPSILILPLFMIATLLAVIVYKRKHQTRNKKREV